MTIFLSTNWVSKVYMEWDRTSTGLGSKFGIFSPVMDMDSDKEIPSSQGMDDTGWMAG